MSRRTAVSLSFASAVLAAVLTAAAFGLAGADPQPTSFTTAVTANESELLVQSDLAPPQQELDEDAPDEDLQEEQPEEQQQAAAEAEAEPLTRAAVNWAAVYELVSPSLVLVQTETGAGSGFFVTADGHIITNYHVITGANRILITLHDAAQHDAVLVAKDVGNDLALLKIDADDIAITVPEFGAVADLRVGDPAAALGAPYNLFSSLTVGIISALDRTRQSGTETFEQLRGLIQTDAALNPGNSGGMLVDAQGRVIGIPTQIESPDRASSGIGFAVSMDTVLRSLPTLLEGNDAERGYLGVSLRELADGLTIADVYCGTTADWAGLEDGDVFVSVNGAAIGTFDDLLALMWKVQPGDWLEIVVSRDGGEVTAEAAAGSWPSEPLNGGCG